MAGAAVVLVVGLGFTFHRLDLRAWREDERRRKEEEEKKRQNDAELRAKERQEEAEQRARERQEERERPAKEAAAKAEAERHEREENKRKLREGLSAPVTEEYLRSELLDPLGREIPEVRQALDALIKTKVERK